MSSDAARTIFLSLFIEAPSLSIEASRLFSFYCREKQGNSQGGVGRAFGHAFGVRVLRIDRPDGRRVLKFDGLSGRGLWYRPYGRWVLLCRLSAVTSTSSIIIILTTVHPFATSWPSSPKGDARTLRIYLSASYVMKSITVISHLRWLSPLWCLTAPKGECISNARQGGCMVFAAKGGIKKGARKGAHLASAAILYNSRGRSTQPVREASADPGQNPWRPGPEARRRHQPSRRSRVNLREYWKAPPKSRPRRRHHRLSSPILREDFSTPLRSGRNDDGPATLGPGPDPDHPKGACP